MELLQLHYFYDSAKTESFAKTAEKYMVPATSVSASVKRLEKELGCPLFDRTSNRITLNDNGKRLQQSLCVIFEELDSTVNSLTLSALSDKREINILARSLRSTLTDYIIEYKEKNPQASFKIAFDFDNNNYENYDIIIDELTDAYHEYEKFELCSLRIRVACSPNSPLCGKQLTLKQLCNQHFITFGEKSNLHKILMNSCKRAGFTPDIVIKVNDHVCYQKCIASGLVLGLSRDYAHKPRDNKTTFLDVKDFNERQTICAFYKKEANYGYVKHFLDFIRSKEM